jgi:hypothetical protein
VKQKGFAHLILLIVIILLVGGYFLYKNTSYHVTEKVNEISVSVSPTKVPTPTIAVLSPIPVSDQSKSWNLYTDTYFTVKYPNTLQAKKYSKEQYSKDNNVPDIGEGFMYNMKTDPPTILSAARLTSNKMLVGIWVFENNDGLTVDDWFTKYTYYPEKFGHTSPVDPDSPNKSQMLGEYSWRKGESDDLFTPRSFLLNEKGKMIFIEFLLLDSNVSDDMLNQIVSTFKLKN